jgi:hypothetical protein
MGRDGRELLNTALVAHSFVSEIDPVNWGVQLSLHKRLALAVSPPLALALESESALPAAANHVADLLAVSHGGAPALVAGVTEISENEGASWRMLAFRAGVGRRYPGSTLAALGYDHGVKMFDVAAAWQASHGDARIALWASLFRSVGAEQAWDRRMFRAFSLLETMAKSTIDKGTPVVDQRGNAILDHGGRPRTASHAREFVYLAVRAVLAIDGIEDQMLLTHPSRTLWEEIGIWLDVRNAVGHEGSWRPIGLPSQTPLPHRQRVTTAFEIAARGDGLDSGWQRYEDACVAGAELVLRAAVRGDFGLAHSVDALGGR